MKLITIYAMAFSLVFSAISAEKKITEHPQPDYSKKSSWVRNPELTNKDCDVFYLHPTTYMDTENGMTASLDNKAVNNRTEDAFQRQATVFSPSCNIFAPRYRQVSIKVLTLSEKERDKALRPAVKDMHAAFKYYLDKLNKGRPYILAAHSQGSNVMLEFLKKNINMIDKSKLIAVYLIGWTVTEDDLKKLKLPICDNPSQTGCVISWNTISEGADSPTLKPGALCVNPLNWKTDKLLQLNSENIYARILLKNGEFLKLSNFTPARIDDRGGLVVPVPSIQSKLNMSMGPGVYHAYDYDFFYGNLVKNAKTRCRAWLKKTHK